MNARSDLEATGHRSTGEFYFPPPGRGLALQDQRTPEQVGLDPSVVRRIGQFLDANRDERRTKAQRWAL